MKKWIVKKLDNGEWKMVGVYSERFAEQMAAAVSDLTRQGYVMYKTIRVEEMKEQADNA